MKNIHVVEQEIWTEKQCRQISRIYIRKDDGSLRFPYPGFIGENRAPHGYGEHQFPDGFEYQGKKWYAVHRPLPIVPQGYVIVNIPQWGYFLVETPVEVLTP